MKKVVIKTCLGYVKCIFSMAAHNAIIKNWGVPTKYSYLSSILSLNNIHGTKLNLICFHSLIKYASVLTCIFITISESNINER